MYLQPRSLVKAGEDFQLDFRLVNESERAFNMLEIGFGTTPAQDLGTNFEIDTVAYAGDIPTLREGDSITVRTLYPGEYVWGTFVTVFMEGLSEEELVSALRSMFTSFAPGSTSWLTVEVLPPLLGDGYDTILN